MDIFNLRDRLISDYTEFTRSFTRIKAPDISVGVDAATQGILGLRQGLQIEQLSPKHKPYLAWHRQYVFAGSQ